MKKVLEAALLAATLGIGFFVFHSWRARRELASRPPSNLPLGPGPDLENPDAPAPAGRPRRGVVELPMLKLTRPPKPSRAGAEVPPPAASAP